MPQRKSRNLRLLLAHEALNSFADGMAALALPLYIYSIAHSLRAVFLWEFIWSAVYVMLFIPIYNLGLRFTKLQNMIALGLIACTGAVFIVGAGRTTNYGALLAANLLWGFGIACSALPKHWFLSTNTSAHQVGAQLSRLGAAEVLSKFAAPLLSGTLCYYVSFQSTFLAYVALRLLALIPILRLTYSEPPGPIRFGVLRRTLAQPELRLVRSAYACEGLSTHLVSLCWILAFSVFVGNTMRLGLLTAVTTVVSLYLLGVTGRLFDTSCRRRLLHRVISLRSLALFGYTSVAIMPHFGYVIFVDLANRISGQMHQLVANSYLYSLSAKFEPIYFLVNREIYLGLCRTLAAAVLVALFSTLSADMLWYAIAAGALLINGFRVLGQCEVLPTSQAVAVTMPALAARETKA